MKHRPTVDDNLIRTAVHDSFGLSFDYLEFLPVGEGAWAYKGTDSSSKKWFIKLSRLDTSNVAYITSYLHHNLGLSFVLSPILPTHQSSSKINDYFLTVYPYIEAETLSYDNLCTKDLIEIATDLRKLHDATVSTAIELLLQKEVFNKYQDSAPELVYRVKQYSGSDDLLTRLRNYVTEKWDIIDRTLTNGKRMSDFCKQNTYQMVMCHTDIHPFNVMKTADALVMIDWDGIMLAPREIDLRHYGDNAKGDTAFHRGYGLDYQADENLLTYYAYEWVLQEYNDYLQRLFDISVGNDPRSHAFNEFVKLFGDGNELGGVVRDALESPLPKV